MSTVSGLEIANNVEREWRDRLDAALKAEREKVAQWMIEKGYATGHGDTIEDLLAELEWQISEQEREACARVCDERGNRMRIASGFPNGDRDEFYCADDIRARSKS